jgi:hypothetical protein
VSVGEKGAEIIKTFATFWITTKITEEPELSWSFDVLWPASMALGRIIPMTFKIRLILVWSWWSLIDEIQMFFYIIVIAPIIWIPSELLVKIRYFIILKNITWETVEYWWNKMITVILQDFCLQVCWMTKTLFVESSITSKVNGKHLTSYWWLICVIVVRFDVF